jgi:hypothetical protein
MYTRRGTGKTIRAVCKAVIALSEGKWLLLIRDESRIGEQRVFIERLRQFLYKEGMSVSSTVNSIEIVGGGKFLFTSQPYGLSKRYEEVTEL